MSLSSFYTEAKRKPGWQDKRTRVQPPAEAMKKWGIKNVCEMVSIIKRAVVTIEWLQCIAEEGLLGDVQLFS